MPPDGIPAVARAPNARATHLATPMSTPSSPGPPEYVFRLQAFAEAMVVADAAFNRGRADAIDRMLKGPEAQCRITAQEEALFSGEAHAACVAFCNALSEKPSEQPTSTNEDNCALLASPVGRAFVDLCLGGRAVPPNVLASGSQGLTRFAEARRARTSREKARAQAEASERKAVEVGFGRSAEGLALAAELEATTRSLLRGDENAAPWLARSDHEPVRATLSWASPGGSAAGASAGGAAGGAADVVSGRGSPVLRVASHNVQERCRNGVLSFVGSLPFVAGRGGLAGRLAGWLLRPEVRAEHASQVLRLVRRELTGSEEAGEAGEANDMAGEQATPEGQSRGERATSEGADSGGLTRGTADVVVLQELSPDVVEALRAAFEPAGRDQRESGGSGRRRFWVHASGAPSPRPGPGECWALTCVVAAVPVEPLPDLEVAAAQASKVVLRRFACVRVPAPSTVLAAPPSPPGVPWLVLASVHVRHPPEKARRAGKRGEAAEALEPQAGSGAAPLTTPPTATAATTADPLNARNVRAAAAAFARMLETTGGGGDGDAGRNGGASGRAGGRPLGILVVGDFNGVVTDVVPSGTLLEDGCAATNEDGNALATAAPFHAGTCALTAAPPQPTVPPPVALPIDGALWLSKATGIDSGWALDCELAARPRQVLGK